MRALSTRNDDPAGASRPFDRGRDGFVIGEGAGVADPRGARACPGPRGRSPSPRSSATAPRPTPATSRCRRPGGVGALRAIRRALEKAGLSLDDVEHVNAHATSTPEGDRTELDMLRGLFGDRAGEVSVTANKSMIGHTLGAAGSIEAIVTMLSLRDGIVPPTINLDDPDEAAAGLDLTPNVARAARDARRREQLVRLRRPEQRPRLPAVGRMSDDLARDPGTELVTAMEAAEAEAPVRRPGSGRRWRGGRGSAVATAGAGAARGRRHAADADGSGLADASLLALVDRLAGILERSDLPELEVEAGGDRASCSARPPRSAAPARGGWHAVWSPRPRARPPEPGSSGSRRLGRRRPEPRHAAAVLAPLTGIFYASPSPGSAPFVAVGREVVVGQVIGLIEAMKLFNEIKSDQAGPRRAGGRRERRPGQGEAPAHRGGTAVSLPQPVPAGRSARISGWGSYAPAAVLTNADLERIVDTSDEWIVSRHRDPRAAGRRGPRDDRLDGGGRRRARDRRRRPASRTTST